MEEVCKAAPRGVLEQRHPCQSWTPCLPDETQSPSRGARLDQSCGGARVNVSFLCRRPIDASADPLQRGWRIASLPFPGAVAGDSISVVVVVLLPLSGSSTARALSDGHSGGG